MYNNHRDSTQPIIANNGNVLTTFPSLFYFPDTEHKSHGFNPISSCNIIKRNIEQLSLIITLHVL